VYIIGFVIVLSGCENSGVDGKTGCLPEQDPLNENLRHVGLVGCVFVPEVAQNLWTPSIPAG
jgi:hypothetical protein